MIAKLLQINFIVSILFYYIPIGSILKSASAIKYYVLEATEASKTFIAANTLTFTGTAPFLEYVVLFLCLMLFFTLFCFSLYFLFTD